ncbi:glycoside hydrolase/deacetylase [Rozella allomycis CSF55]|uniref:Glycoside hydrolase/deacetylase n=1 Tax=Rozella allomycis (strain CSF55) TaxID=988480 RepID=A0A075AVH2_ROZAC|nr:Glycoside hydrolase/deacetylase, beta/alpha-barrel domain-containing protein [Rozella allomycis CSF55]RKP21973.1 glycoside hydrolase/deacetylase [Rozella allomycis CSF55]|eukprot:EPZ32702.1 Glycoside hydrolase/deacetylase, beta/alpha-barrel domain-containing protein [Rozella allomycis CSF55]
MKLLAILLSALALNNVNAEVKKLCVTPGDFALTFDNGPSANTDSLLLKLRDSGLKATFHIVASYTKDPVFQMKTKNIAAEGHVIGIRAEPSWNLLTMSDADVRANFAAATAQIKALTNLSPKFVRLPVGGYTAQTVSVLESMGYVVSEASLDSMDYMPNITASNVLNTFQTAVNQSAGFKTSYISVQNEPVMASVEAVPSIISFLKGAGNNLVTLDKCLQIAATTDGSTYKADGASKQSSSGSSVATWTGLSLIASTALAVVFQWL